jgi:hypothetical protein
VPQDVRPFDWRHDAGSLHEALHYRRDGVTIPEWPAWRTVPGPRADLPRNPERVGSAFGPGSPPADLAQPVPARIARAREVAARRVNQEARGDRRSQPRPLAPSWPTCPPENRLPGSSRNGCFMRVTTLCLANWPSLGHDQTGHVGGAPNRRRATSIDGPRRLAHTCPVVPVVSTKTTLEMSSPGRQFPPPDQPVAGVRWARTPREAQLRGARLAPWGDRGGFCLCPPGPVPGQVSWGVRTARCRHAIVPR